jgi:phage FluMu protein Com
MFKNIIAPMQAWLLSQGKCVGCGKILERKKGKGLMQVTCPCGRVYMYDTEGKKFRRATLDEIK